MSPPVVRSSPCGHRPRLRLGDLLDRLDHGFHPAGRDLRYTIGPDAQREIFDRLLELNHERYAEEVAKGLHDKKVAKGLHDKKKARTARASKKSDAEGLF